jgi:hypothetical protein
MSLYSQLNTVGVTATQLIQLIQDATQHLNMVHNRDLREAEHCFRMRDIIVRTTAQRSERLSALENVLNEKQRLLNDREQEIHALEQDVMQLLEDGHALRVNLETYLGINDNAGQGPPTPPTSGTVNMRLLHDDMFNPTPNLD